MILPIIVQSVLTTLCVVSTLAVLWLFNMCKKHEQLARKIVDDLSVAHNQNQKTIEHIIEKLHDVEMKASLRRS